MVAFLGQCSLEMANADAFRDGKNDKKTNVSPQRSGGDLFIVDNSEEDWKVRDYLREWTEISVSFDIATGFFEIGSLLTLDGHW